MIILVVLVLTIPQLSPISDRIFSFLLTIFGNKSGDPTTSDSSTVFRLNMIINGFEMFLRKPLFGFGVEGFSAYGGMNEGWSHNHFSEMLCNFGVIGTFFFHFPLIVPLFFQRKKENTIVAMLIGIFFCCMLSIALFSNKFYALLCPLIFASSDFSCKRYISVSFDKKIKLLVSKENDNFEHSKSDLIA